MSGPYDRYMKIYVCVIGRSPISKPPRSQSSMASFDYSGQNLGGGGCVVGLCCYGLCCVVFFWILLSF